MHLVYNPYYVVTTTTSIKCLKILYVGEQRLEGLVEVIETTEEKWHSLVVFLPLVPGVAVIHDSVNYVSVF